MTYIRELERDLRALLEEGDEAKIIRFAKEGGVPNELVSDSDSSPVCKAVDE